MPGVWCQAEISLHSIVARQWDVAFGCFYATADSELQLKDENESAE